MQKNNNNNKDDKKNNSFWRPSTSPTTTTNSPFKPLQHKSIDDILEEESKAESKFQKVEANSTIPDGPT